MRRLVLSACVVLTAGAVVSMRLSPAGAAGGAGCSSWSGAGFTNNGGGDADSGGGSSSGSGSGSGSGGSSDAGGVMGEDSAVNCTGYEAGPLDCNVSLSGAPPIIFAYVDASWSNAVPHGGTFTSGTYYEVNIDTYNGALTHTTKQHAVLVVDACSHTMSYNDDGTIQAQAGSYAVDDAGTTVTLTAAQSCCQQTMNCSGLQLGYTALEGAIIFFTTEGNGGNRMEMYIKQ